MLNFCALIISVLTFGFRSDESQASQLLRDVLHGPPSGAHKPTSRRAANEIESKNASSTPSNAQPSNAPYNLVGLADTQTQTQFTSVSLERGQGASNPPRFDTARKEDYGRTGAGGRRKNVGEGQKSVDGHAQEDMMGLGEGVRPKSLSEHSAKPRQQAAKGVSSDLQVAGPSSAQDPSGRTSYYAPRKAQSALLREESWSRLDKTETTRRRCRRACRPQSCSRHWDNPHLHLLHANSCSYWCLACYAYRYLRIFSLAASDFVCYDWYRVIFIHNTNQHVLHAVTATDIGFTRSNSAGISNAYVKAYADSGNHHYCGQRCVCVVWDTSCRLGLP